MKNKLKLAIAAAVLITGLSACQSSFTHPPHFTHPPSFQQK